MNDMLSLQKLKALERMQLSQHTLRNAMASGPATVGGKTDSHLAMMLLTWLAPRVLKPIMGLFQGEPIAKTLDGLLDTLRQQFNKTLGPVIDQHPFVSVLVAATAGALMVKYRRFIVDFLVKHLVP
jgi:hypothetical protein